MLENSFLPIGGDSSYGTLNLRSALTQGRENLGIMLGVYRHKTLIVSKIKELIEKKICKKTTIFQVIGKKNNQSSVSDADLYVNLGSTGYLFTLGFGFLGMHRGSMIDSISVPSSRYRKNLKIGTQKLFTVIVLKMEQYYIAGMRPQDAYTKEQLCLCRPIFPDT